jgi:hypothetical protein
VLLAASARGSSSAVEGSAAPSWALWYMGVLTTGSGGGSIHA